MDIVFGEKLDKIARRSKNDLVYFTNKVFAASFEKFKTGNHVDNTMQFLQDHKKTARVSAKDHFKSTSLYSHFMHKLLFNEGEDYFLFSFMDQMSGWHIAKIKALISANPFFEGIKDLKKNAETVIKYQWPDRKPITLSSKGMLSFKKGIHCHGVYVDDPFQEEAKKITGEQVKKINNRFTTEIMDIPYQDGFLHVVGTAQTHHDFFFNKKVMSRFAVKIIPAIINEALEKVLWPEHMDYEELCARRGERGDKVFNQEYMCKPSWSEDAFFKREILQKVVNPKLIPLRIMNDNVMVVGGWDLGKRSHPAHVTVFAKYSAKKWTQIYEKWFDHVDHNKQLLEVEDLIERLKIDTLGYDATRGEFETEEERGDLPSEMIPYVFKLKTKHDMATNFEKMVLNSEIELLNKERQFDQILSVDNDLNALQGPEGHGDSFWSTAMALHLANEETESFDEGI